MTPDNFQQIRTRLKYWSINQTITRIYPQATKLWWTAPFAEIAVEITLTNDFRKPTTK